MKNAAIALLFLASIGFANWLTTRSWNGLVYVYIGEQRAPASVRTAHDYTPVDRQALGRSVHEQLMSMAATSRQDGNVGVTLGHPLVARPEGGGGREFACEVAGHGGIYDHMEITFYGTGVSDNGDEPHMVIDADCEASAQLDVLNPVWIPMGEIVRTSPRDQEFQVSGPHPTRIRLEHIPGVWPESWVLVSVRFYRQDTPDESLLVDAQHLREGGPTLLSFDFKADGSTSR
jgi:hypothetical protein